MEKREKARLMTKVALCDRLEGEIQRAYEEKLATLGVILQRWPALPEPEGRTARERNAINKREKARTKKLVALIGRLEEDFQRAYDEKLSALEALLEAWPAMPKPKSLRKAQAKRRAEKRMEETVWQKPARPRIRLVP